jgi:hypothetical protein
MNHFKIIDKFPNYSVSSSGIVINNTTLKTLVPVMDKGYKSVTLYADGKKKPIKIYRLVAEAFIPNTQNKPVVNHIDGIKTNDDYTNLEWVTIAENVAHAVRTGLWTHPENAGRPKQPIEVYDAKNGNLISVHESINRAIKVYGLNRSNVRNVLRGSYYSTNGLTFKLIN